MSMFAQLIVACLAAAPAAPMTSVDAASPPGDVAIRVATESFSKLRKIHLVRPDLIAYPLVVDVIC